MRNKFTPEKKLVRLLSKFNLDEATFQEIEPLITSETNWSFLIEFAIDQQVASLIYANLKRFGKQELIPSDYFALFKEKYIAAYGWNVVIFDELKFVLELFRNEGIDVVVLKGPMLLDTIYKDWGVRKTSDLDLLVKKDELNRAQQLLRENNFLSASKQIVREDGIPVHHHAAPMARMKRPAIELHWTLHPNTKHIRIDLDEIWKNVRRGKIDNSETLFLSIEDTIIHLCIHYFDKLKSKITHRKINDIVAVIQKYSATIDWKKIVKNSYHYNISPCVYAGLFFVNERLPNTIPQIIQNNLKFEYSAEFFDKLHIKQIIGQRLFSFSRQISLAGNLVDKWKEFYLSFFPSNNKLCNKFGLSQDSKKAVFYRIFHPGILLYTRINLIFHYIYLLCRKNLYVRLNKAGLASPITPATDFNIE